MPAIYAHDRFGEMVAQQMPDHLVHIINQHYTQFEIGLQGPDLFFFYRFNTKNPVVAYGEDLHHVPADSFFRHGIQVVQKYGTDSPQYAYLLGFLCHFALDSECHPYVNKMTEQTGIHHLEIEEEFEKMLLRLDEQDPLGYPLADLIPTDEKTVKAIYPFYRQGEPITPRIVYHSLVYMKLIKKILTAPSALHQNLVNGVFRLSGHYAAMKGLMNQKEDNPDCEETNSMLFQKMDAAVPVALDLMDDLHAAVTEKKTLCDRFRYTFD